MQTKNRIWQTVAIFFILLLLLFVAKPQISLMARDVSLLMAQRTDEAYLQSRQYDTYNLFVNFGILASVFSIILVWRKPLMNLWKRLTVQNVFVLALVFFVAFAASACNAKRDYVVVGPEEVAFVIPLRGENAQSQEVIQNETYWQNNLANRTEIEINYECVQIAVGTPCDMRPLVSVIKVSTESVSVTWNAVRNPDGTINATFSGQSVNSEGVYTGMIVQARVLPENAALYLANFGSDPNGVYDTVNTEVENFLQDAFTRAVGSLTIDEMNAQLVSIFDNIQSNAREYFVTQGLTIEIVGNVDGFLFENPEIQRAIDEAWIRSQQLEIAESSARQTQIYSNGLLTQTQSYVNGSIQQTGTMVSVSIAQTATLASVAVGQTSTANSLFIERAGAQATATYLSGAAQAEVLRMQSEALGDNGMALAAYEYARRWSGYYPSIMMGDPDSLPGTNPLQMYMQLTPPAEFITPSPVPTATVTPTPVVP